MDGLLSLAQILLLVEPCDETSGKVITSRTRLITSGIEVID